MCVYSTTTTKEISSHSRPTNIIDKLTVSFCLPILNRHNNDSLGSVLKDSRFVEHRTRNY